MKALLVTAIPCDEVRRLRPESHLGFRTIGCNELEHLILADGRTVRARKKCDECVLGMLLKSSFVLSGPTITQDGLVKIAVADTPTARRALRSRRGQVVSVEDTDIRNIVLTPRQRTVVSLLADGAGNIAGVARALGISKPAAWKLIKKSIRKIAKLQS